MAIDKIPSAGIESGGVAPSNLSTGAPTWNTSGDVGIGTSSPASRLHIQGATDCVLTNTAISGSSWFAGSNTSSYILHNTSNTPMLFTTNGTERARIDTSGNLLVGTSSALGTLTVNGNISPVQAPSSNWGVDFAPSSSSGTFVTIANNGTYDIAAGSGMIWIMEESGVSGFCQIACWYGNTAVVWQSASGYSVTVNTASKINIYFAPTTPNKYRIQNTTGSSKSIWISTIKMRLSV